jgi:hypothetical protein
VISAVSTFGSAAMRSANIDSKLKDAIIQPETINFVATN